MFSRRIAGGDVAEELTDEQIAEEEKFLAGLPWMNLGAFFMPGVWGPAHGFWACILFYPLYLLADNLLYGVYTQGEAWQIVLAIAAIIVLLALHIGFARVSGPLSAHRAQGKGVSRETYVKRERIWMVVSIVIAVAFLAWGTYYNLSIRPYLT